MAAILKRLLSSLTSLVIAQLVPPVLFLGPAFVALGILVYGTQFLMALGLPEEDAGIMMVSVVILLYVIAVVQLTRYGLERLGETE